MPLRVSINSLIGLQGSIGKSSRALGGTLEKQASGQRINRASDDAAGLAISEKLRSQLTSIDQAANNISAGSALLRTAEGGLGQIASMLARGKELAVQASNGTLNDQQRNTLNQEYTQIKEEIDRITSTTEFNGTQLLTGDLGPGGANPISVQVGTENSQNDQITIDTIESTNTPSLGVATTSIGTAQEAQNAISAIDNAISRVASNRASVGAVENRFDSAISNLSVTKENLTAAESQTRDTDYAEQIVEQRKNQNLLQVGVNSLRQGLQQNENLIGSLLNRKG